MYVSGQGALPVCYGCFTFDGVWPVVVAHGRWLMGGGSWEVADLHCVFLTSVYFPLLLHGLVVTARSFI